MHPIQLSKRLEGWGQSTWIQTVVKPIATRSLTPEQYSLHVMEYCCFTLLEISINLLIYFDLIIILTSFRLTIATLILFARNDAAPLYLQGLPIHATIPSRDDGLERLFISVQQGPLQRAIQGNLSYLTVKLKYLSGNGSVFKVKCHHS